MDNDDGEHLYFVFETKGNIDNNRESEKYKIECGKKHFACLDQDVRYLVRTDLKHLDEGTIYFDPKY